MKKGNMILMAATYDGDNNRIFQISYAGSESKVKQDSSIKSAYTSENGNSYAWEDGNGNGGNGTGNANTGNGTTTTNKVHNHTGNNSDGTKHANCKVCSDDAKASNEEFVQALADETVVVAGKELLPVGKQNSYKDYELISYINDVTINNAEVLVEYGANGTPTGTYEYGLERLSVEYVNSAKEYYLYNGTGSVVQTSEENGSLFLRYTYDPFGETTSIRSPLTVDIDDLNRYTYNGEDYDYNTGLQYLRARYYSTSTGNFISQDTYLGDTLNPLSQNRYTYCHNNPVMYDDPSGHLIDIRDTVNDILKFGNEQFQKTKKHVSSKLESTKTYLSKRLLEANINLYVSNCEKGIEFDANLLLLTDYYDPEKGYYDFDNFAQIEAAYEYLAVKTLQNELYDAPDFVLSRGSYFSLNMPDIVEGFQLGFSLQFGYAVDKEGNISLFFTYAEGEYVGSSGLSVGGFLSISDAPNSEKISGEGSSAGGSVSIPIPDGPAISVGAEATSAYDEETQETYEGISVSVGVAPPSPGAEIHTLDSNTWVIKTINIFNKYDNLYMERMRK